MSDAQRPVERVTTFASGAEAWRNRVGIFLWLVGTALLLTFASRLSVPVLLVCGALWVGVLGLVASKSWLLFLGPVFFYDAVRLGRRKWVFWFRSLFAFFLGAILLLMYRSYFEYRYRPPGASTQVSIAEYARFAEEFFHVFVTIQVIIIGLLTPAYIAPAIAEEKERRTLEFLFATDLRNREILFGKLAARLGTLTLFLLAGLPILTLTQFFGGVDPNQVIVYTLGTLILMLFLAAIAIWCSVSVKKSRDAIMLAFLIPLAYHAISFISYGLARQSLLSPYWINESISLFGASISTADAMFVFGEGNFFVHLLELSDAVRGGAVYSVELWKFLGYYALFHVVVIGLLLLVAVLRLRPLGLRQTGGESKSKPRRGRVHPPVSERPMIWKEVYVESSFRAGWTGKILLFLIASLSFVPAMIGAYLVYFDDANRLIRPSPERLHRFARDMNEYVRTVSTLVTVLLLLAAAIRGAGSVRGEKDKQTFDSLMTSPLSVREILWGKWWGCMLGHRMGLLWLGMIWVIGLLSGGLHPWAVPLLLAALAVFLSGFAWIGIWCSINCSTTLRATTWALAGGILFGGGYLAVLSLCCFCIAPRAGGDGMEVIMKMVVSFSPPVTMSYLPFSEFDREQLRYIGGRDDVWAVYAFIGWAGWVLLSFVLSSICILKFRRDNNRTGYREDDPFGQRRGLGREPRRPRESDPDDDFDEMTDDR
jgi:ABC-type transport system involved in multi-copper enzyme maturation permease subunit